MQWHFNPHISAAIVLLPGPLWRQLKHALLLDEGLWILFELMHDPRIHKIKVATGLWHDVLTCKQTYISSSNSTKWDFLTLTPINAHYNYDTLSMYVSSSATDWSYHNYLKAVPVSGLHIEPEPGVHAIVYGMLGLLEPVYLVQPIFSFIFSRTYDWLAIYQLEDNRSFTKCIQSGV